MKLTEGMDANQTSTATTNGDLLSDKALVKTGKNSTVSSSSERVPETCASNGQNGRTDFEKILNGNVSPDSPSNVSSSPDGIGIIGESYSDLNSPHSPENQCEGRCNSEEDRRGDKSISDSCSNVDTSDTEKFRNENSIDIDGGNDSSLLSEEFQLRLSDDDDQHEELPKIVNSTSLAGEGVISSATKDISSVREPSAIHEEAERHQSGSGTLEGIHDTLMDALSPSLSTIQVDKEQTEKVGDHTVARIQKDQSDTKFTAEFVEELESSPSAEFGGRKISVEGSGVNEVDEVMSNSPRCEIPPQTQDSDTESKNCSSNSVNETQEDIGSTEDDKLLEIEDQCGATGSRNPGSSGQSLEEKIEAELEAELEAEIAAQLKSKEDFSKSHQRAIVAPDGSDFELLKSANENASEIRTASSNSPPQSCVSVEDSSKPESNHQKISVNGDESALEIGCKSNDILSLDTMNAEGFEKSNSDHQNCLVSVDKSVCETSANCDDPVSVNSVHTEYTKESGSKHPTILKPDDENTNEQTIIQGSDDKSTSESSAVPVSGDPSFPKPDNQTTDVPAKCSSPINSQTSGHLNELDSNHQKPQNEGSNGISATLSSRSNSYEERDRCDSEFATSNKSPLGDSGSAEEIDKSDFGHQKVIEPDDKNTTDILTKFGDSLSSISEKNSDLKEATFDSPCSKEIKSVEFQFKNEVDDSTGLKLKLEMKEELVLEEEEVEFNLNIKTEPVTSANQQGASSYFEYPHVKTIKQEKDSPEFESIEKRLEVKEEIFDTKIKQEKLDYDPKVVKTESSKVKLEATVKCDQQNVKAAPFNQSDLNSTSTCSEQVPQDDMSLTVSNVVGILPMESEMSTETNEPSPDSHTAPEESNPVITDKEESSTPQENETSLPETKKNSEAGVVLQALPENEVAKDHPCFPSLLEEKEKQKVLPGNEVAKDHPCIPSVLEEKEKQEAEADSAAPLNSSEEIQNVQQKATEASDCFDSNLEKPNKRSTTEISSALDDSAPRDRRSTEDLSKDNAQKESEKSADTTFEGSISSAASNSKQFSEECTESTPQTAETSSMSSSDDSRKHEEDHPVKSPDPTSNIDPDVQGNKILQSPESKLLDSDRNLDSPLPDSFEESDDSEREDNFDDCGKSFNGDNSDTASENNQAVDSEDDNRSKDKNLDVNRESNINDFASPEFTDNISVSPTFDSTVLDAPPADDMDSQDCSSSVNENESSKDKCVPASRKRTLSPSHDDVFDSWMRKRVNGFSDSSAASTNQDNGLKRPAEVTLDSDPKKLRVSGGNKSFFEDCDKTDNLKSKDEDGKKETELSSGLGERFRSEHFNSDKSPTAVSTERSQKNYSSNSGAPKSVDLPFLRKLHKKEVSKMSRADLEELVLQKICEAVTERSIVGELRLRCQVLEQRQEKETEKFTKLRKQMTELSIVMRKYMDSQKSNVSGPPIKVTRSVGLQVCQVSVGGCQLRWKPPTCGMHSHPGQLPQLPQPLQPLQPPQPPQPPPPKPVSSTPSKPDSAADTKKSPVKTYRNLHSPRPSSNVVSSTDPPALVPTGSLTPVSKTIPMRPSVPQVTPPRVPLMPPLQQISGPRPRYNGPSPVSSTTPQLTQVQSKQQPNSVRPSTPQNQINQPLPSNVVEVIDIENEDQSKKPSGYHVSVQQMQHQQKQAANAAAHSLAGNNGLTVRLITPTQASQAGISFTSANYPQLVVPPQKMIVSTAPGQGSTLRANLKLVMKGSSANFISLMQPNLGAAVPTSIVRIPTSTQEAMQIFTNASSGNKTNTVATVNTSSVHPAPLPALPLAQQGNPGWKQIPPRPNLKIQHQNNGIVLSWNMALGPAYADIGSYQLFAYQEGSAPPNPGLWKKVGEVKALPLPMACTLTQFVEGHRYHFTVRAVDKHGRVGPFSQQGSIRLGI